MRTRNKYYFSFSNGNNTRPATPSNSVLAEAKKQISAAMSEKGTVRVELQYRGSQYVINTYSTLVDKSKLKPIKA
jgi:hypothetical protein